MWMLIAIAFFTISWPVFLAFFIPVTIAALLVLRRLRSHTGGIGAPGRMKMAVRTFGVSAALLSTFWLALSPQVWLPLRIVSVQPGQTVEVGGQPVASPFSAYVLNTTDKTTSLLLDKPRAVVEVPSSTIQPNPPLCVPRPSPLRWLFLRASQMVHLDHDYGSPYVRCPDT
jgi:hypothetical protein